MHMRWSLLIALLAAISLQADTVYLLNGGSLEGRVRYDRDKVIIEQLAGDVILDASRVDYVEQKKTVLDEFEERNKALLAKADVTADEWSALGRFALENGITRHVEQPFRKALTINPDHAPSRLALGYVKYEGTWMKPDEANRARGLVQHNGSWVTPEAKSELVRLEAEKDTALAKAEVERLKLARTERQLELIEAQADAQADRYAGRDYYDGYYVSAPSYWLRPGFVNKPGKPGKPVPPPVTQPARIGDSMFPRENFGQSLFPR